MKKPRRPGRLALSALCLALLAALICLLPQLLAPQDAQVPGLHARERSLLRIWLVNAPGGAQQWLTGQLRQWEKQHSGAATYLRTVSASELTAQDAVLPDLVLYMPGDVAVPAALFLPLGGEAVEEPGGISPALMRAGRWQDQQYGLPLCWGAWALAISSTLEPESAVTPAPTTLLGRPAATAAQATAEPGYPLEAASAEASALQSPGGAALFSLGMLLPMGERPALAADFAQLSAAEVYAGFRQRKWPSAMLTTGQITAFTALTSAGSGFPFRVMAPDEIVTDQVLLASVTPDAPREAALLLAWLIDAAAQEALFSQGLHTVLENLSLYTAGPAAQVEQAARRGLYAVNAYLPAQEVSSRAWQFFQGTPLSDALPPLM